MLIKWLVQCKFVFWTTFNKPKVDDVNWKVLFVPSPRMTVSIFLPGLFTLGRSDMSVSKSVTNLGIVIDSNLSMKDHLSSVLCAINIELCRISYICCYLTTGQQNPLYLRFSLSRLDYCNGLFVNCHAETFDKLQRVQKNAARLVPCVPRFDHIFSHLRTLHWLPTEAHIKIIVLYKIALMAYKAVNLSGPSFFPVLISIYTPARSTWFCRKFFYIDLITAYPCLPLLNLFRCSFMY